MKKLLDNPDDTRQVFHIIEALKGDSLKVAVTRLKENAKGQKLLSEKPNILTPLNDEAWLAELPDGSIGKEYYNFVHREDLSAGCLVEASRAAPKAQELSKDERWLADRLRDIHDLQHVMTGYGRDPLGELSLLSFMTTQTPNRGINFIIWVAKHRYKRSISQFDLPTLLREGADIGSKAVWMPEISWEEMLPQSLAEVRHQLGFQSPSYYRELRYKAPEIMFEVKPTKSSLVS